MLQQAEPIVHHPFSYQYFTGFGLAVLLAFVIAQIIAQRELARRGHDPSPIPDLIFAAVIGGLLGAKLYYAIFFGGWEDLFSRAGFVFWGGLIGGIVAVLFVVWRKGLSIPRISDVGGICVAAAYSVGRTGCWAVGDDYGHPWNSRWAVAFPEGAPPSTAESMYRNFGTPIPEGMAPTDVHAVHPTQIYETVLAFGMFLILWRLRGHRHAEGWLFGMYCVLAGIERFIIEFFRAKDDRWFGGLTMAQMISIGFVVLGVTIMYFRRNRGPGSPGIYAPGHEPVAAAA
jgi:phosphatidylglycerol---prolipoprotein diacylglyceryl transferase